jgi:outer membrane protein assembly factor BamB
MMLEALVEVMKSLKEEEIFKEAITDDLIEQVRMTNQNVLAMLRTLEEMEIRFRRFTHLAGLSKLYDHAKTAEEEGRLDDALTLYSRLVNEYGEGQLKEEFQKKQAELEDFFDDLEEINRHTEAQDIEKAYHLAQELLGRYEDPAHTSFVRVPVRLTSMPSGALIRSEGGALGKTPHTVYLQRDQRMNISAELEGFERKFFVINRSGGAERTLFLNRCIQYQVKLSGIVEALPLLDEEGLILPSRSGLIYHIDPATGDVLRKFNTGSLSGIPSSVVKAHGFLYFNTMEGALWALSPENFQLQHKKELSAGTRCPPLTTPEGVITACLDGKITCHDSSINTERWMYSGEGKILVDPVIQGEKLIAAFSTGDLVCLGIRNGEALWRFQTGFAEITGLAAAKESIVACSDNGWVKKVESKSGRALWAKDLDCFINQPPLLDGDQVFVSAHREIFVLNLADGKVTARMPAGGKIMTRPAVDGGFICYGTDDSNLHFRAVGAQESAWVFRATNAATSPPLMTDKMVYFIDGAGQLYAVLR